MTHISLVLITTSTSDECYVGRLSDTTDCDKELVTGMY